MFKLTRDNYHSIEANQAYMSNSQYKSFLTCEAATLAELREEFVPKTSDALLVGSYVHAWNEGTLDEFRLNTPELFTKKGELYSQYKFADRMIDALRQDEFCMFALKGDKEVIFAAEMFGVPWKIMIDSYNKKQGRFADIKTVRSINELQWSQEAGSKVSFIEQYNYMRQFSIYAEVERLATNSDKWMEPILVTVSKEDPPDKALISLVDDVRMKYELEQIQINLPHIMDVKIGKVEPKRCERCEYCRATKKIESIIHYSSIGA